MVRLLILLALLAGPTVCRADSFRCGTYLALEGMGAAELQEKCGRPDLIRTTAEPIVVRRPDGTFFDNGIETTDFWYYERGPNEFVARVTIRESVVEKIDLLEARLISALNL